MTCVKFKFVRPHTDSVLVMDIIVKGWDENDPDSVNRAIEGAEANLPGWIVHSWSVVSFN